MARTKKPISAKLDLPNRLSFGFLNQTCPKSLVDEVLTALGKCSKRIRKFPAAAVVYFVIIMSLWRESSIEEVLRILVENINSLNGTPDIVSIPVKSSISEARTQLGSQVMQEIASRVLQPIAPAELLPAWYRGLRLMAIDGSSFDLPDEVGNAEYFGYPSSSRGETAFPQARVLCLVETGTHAIVAAEIGPYRTSEQVMAKSLFNSGKLTSDMLLMADRNFYGYNLWSLACSTGAKLLWRVKLNLQLPQEEILPDGSFISTVYDSRERSSCIPLKVRVIEYNLSDTKNLNSDQLVGQESYKLITNILSSEEAPAVELAALYHERWEIENLFGEFKDCVLSNGTIVRSKTPVLVEQELWGMIIIHFALRKIMADGAWKRQIDPDRLSFKSSVYIIKRKLPRLAASPPSGKKS